MPESETGMSSDAHGEERSAKTAKATTVASSSIAPVAPPEIRGLANLINGCKDDLDGVNAKVCLIKSYVASGGKDLLDVVCWMHLVKSITVDPAALLEVVSWLSPVGERAGTSSALDARRPGMFLASALQGCAADEMRSVVGQYVTMNAHIDAVDVLRCVNQHGFMHADAAALLSTDVIDWKKPIPGGKVPRPWTKLWDGPLPSGLPTYVNVRDLKGRKASIAFLGTATDSATSRMLTAEEVLVGQWKLTPPGICISADAGSMHPRQADAISMLANLPQFSEWVADACASTVGRSAMPSSPDIEEGATGAGSLRMAGSVHSRPVHSFGPQRHASISLQELMHRSVESWQEELMPVDTDVTMKDGSINNLIYTKLTQVFAALLDAAALAGSWVIVDRTNGQGSATAEILLELALERGASRPVIVAIDSLERLGKARAGRRSHQMLKQLCMLFDDADGATQAPNGTEKELRIDWIYSLEEFDKSSNFASIPDSQLPFQVLAEHMRKAHSNTCEPNRKWRYFYVDGVFANATHYIIKSNERDEFDIESVAKMGFLYAHGDTRTYKRLRANIQQAKPIVMLHNSGGVVTAFSWLQRVMAFSQPAPSTERLRGPLKFLIANLSRANWVRDFGVPEVMMLRSLAERSPTLFRTKIVSVDILTDSEERMLEVMTNCFATSADMPELGLGNDVNVVLNAWNLHLMLCENATGFWAKSVLAQVVIWVLAIFTTAAAIGTASLGTSHNRDGAVLQRFLTLDQASTAEVIEYMSYTVLILPIVTALVTTVSLRLAWRDKWSICEMTATQLVAEIYKFRMATLEYDGSPLTSPHGCDAARPPMSAKQNGQGARQTFVERIQAFYGSCMTEMSQSGALRRKRAKVTAIQRQDHRINQESKPTLSQWYAIKLHAEKRFCNTSWALPTNHFVNWMAGLAPYLQQSTLHEELRAIIEGQIAKKKMVLGGKPLTEAQGKSIRHSLATKLGMRKTRLDPQREEINQLEHSVIAEMCKEQAEDGHQNAVEREAPQGYSRHDAMGLPLSTPTCAGVAYTPMASGRLAVAPARAVPRGAAVAPNRLDEACVDPHFAMRKVLMEMQGERYGKFSAKEKRDERRRKRSTPAVLEKDVEDDYLFGPLTVESYVIFRARPVAEHFENQAARLSFRLQCTEVVAFVANATGAALAIFEFSEWVSLSVAAVYVVSSIAEFAQLRNQVVSLNLALRDLQSMLVWWDSLSLVQRRTDATRAQIVNTTERAILQVTDAQTTAASNTQASVEQKLVNDVAINADD